jgi:hypothetical protein
LNGVDDVGLKLNVEFAMRFIAEELLFVSVTVCDVDVGGLVTVCAGKLRLPGERLIGSWQAVEELPKARHRPPESPGPVTVLALLVAANGQAAESTL